jgi:hypothetical protein
MKHLYHTHPNPLSYIVIHPHVSYDHPSLTALERAYPKTFQSLHNPMVQQATLDHPRRQGVFYPHGTTAESMLYDLQHDEAVPSVEKITPAILRQIRDMAYGARKMGSRVHVFGVLDHDSPYGSRCILEHLVRMFRELGVESVLHVGVWYPTPKEFTTGLHEIETLCDATTYLGSVFPIDVIEHQSAATQKYIDGILHPPAHHTEATIHLPLYAPVIVGNEALLPEDRILIANHTLHGMQRLQQALERHGLKVQCFDHAHAPHRTIVDSLRKKQHTMSLTNNKAYQEAYFGTDLKHPYFETYYHPSAEAVLEMVLSPHFGYHATPFRSVMLFDAAPTVTFDSLLQHYLRSQQQKQHDFVCLFLQPDQVEGSPLFAQLQPLHQPIPRYKSHVSMA